MEDNKLIIKNTNNIAYLSYYADQLLKDTLELANYAEVQKNRCREAILQAMIDNNIYDADLEHFKISQVIPKDKVEFDTQAFVEQENKDIVAAFTTTTEEEYFDKDKLIEDLLAADPTLKEAYTIKQKTYTVDTTKLQKIMPDVYERYTTVTKSDKKITIRITEKKVK